MNKNGNSHIKVCFREKIGYAAGDTANNLIFGMLSSYALVFFTDVALLPVGIVTSLLLLARVWDAVNDPLMGVITDRLNPRTGKYRPYFLILPIPLAILFVLTFTTPPGGTTIKLIYAFVMYNLLMMTYTAINVPYGALITTITNEPGQRIDFSSVRTLGAAVGNLIVSGSALYFVNLFGKDDTKKGYLYTAMLFGLLSVLLFYFLYFNVKEHVRPEPAPKTGIGKNLMTILKSPVWLLFFLMVFMIFGNMFSRISSTTYYFIYVVHRPDLIGLFFSCVTLVQILGALLANCLSKIMARRKILLLSGTVCVVIYTSLFFVNVQNIILLFVLHIIGGTFVTLNIPLMGATVGDIADYFSIREGIQAAGVVSASVTFSNKLSLSFFSAIVGWFLAFTGYVPNEMQNAQTLGVMNAAMSLIPAICSIVFMIGVMSFPLFKQQK
ncbi:MFS transporter [Hungatella hathewayi]|uniref:MFS transporter n=1 Tax=Hungatella hathewayi TaxID=154046 RepID=UPI0035682027